MHSQLLYTSLFIFGQYQVIPNQEPQEVKSPIFPVSLIFKIEFHKSVKSNVHDLSLNDVELINTPVISYRLLVLESWNWNLNAKTNRINMEHPV